jgi:hypothetical protein
MQFLLRRKSCPNRSKSWLRKETILNLGKFRGLGAFHIVVGHVIDPRADWAAPHQPSIAGLQQFGRRITFFMPGSSHRS